MELLTSEKEIEYFGKAGIVLTNFRLLQRNKSRSNAYNLDVFLEDISSIETKYENIFVLLILAVLSVLFQLYMIFNFHNPLHYSGFIVGVLFFFLWWTSRKFNIVVTSRGGKELKFELGRIKDHSVYGFISRVQNEKLKRINQLHGLNSDNKNPIPPN